MDEDEGWVVPDVGGMCEAEIDYNVMESFPASDPPSWTLGISPRKKWRSHFDAGMLSENDPSHQNQAPQQRDGGAAG